MRLSGMEDRLLSVACVSIRLSYYRRHYYVLAAVDYITDRSDWEHPGLPGGERASHCLWCLRRQEAAGTSATAGGHVRSDAARELVLIRELWISRIVGGTVIPTEATTRETANNGGKYVGEDKGAPYDSDGDEYDSDEYDSEHVNSLSASSHSSMNTVTSEDDKELLLA